MDISELTRFTADADPIGAPCAQVYAKDRQVWFDLKLFFSSLVLDHKMQCFRDCKQCWTSAYPSDGQDFHMQASSTPSTHVANARSPRAMYACFARYLVVARVPQTKEAARLFTTQACSRVQELDAAAVVAMGGEDTGHLRFGLRQVVGLHEVAKAFSAKLQMCLQTMWQNMGPGSPWDAHAHELFDVVIFSSLGRRARKHTGSLPAPSSLAQ